LIKLASRLLGTNARAAHDADARAPVFVEVEAVHLDLWRDEAGEHVKAAMKSKERRDEIDERRVVLNLQLAEKFGLRDVPPPPVSFDLSPVVAASLSTTLEDLRLKNGGPELNERRTARVCSCRQSYG